MADPYEQAFAELGQALVDLDGDGRPDVQLAPGYQVRKVGEQGSIPAIFGPDGNFVTEVGAFGPAQADAERRLSRARPGTRPDLVENVNSYRRAIGQPGVEMPRGAVETSAVPTAANVAPASALPQHLIPTDPAQRTAAAPVAPITPTTADYGYGLTNAFLGGLPKAAADVSYPDEVTRWDRGTEAVGRFGRDLSDLFWGQGRTQAMGEAGQLAGVVAGIMGRTATAGREAERASDYARNFAPVEMPRVRVNAGSAPMPPIAPATTSPSRLDELMTRPPTVPAGRTAASAEMTPAASGSARPQAATEAIPSGAGSAASAGTSAPAEQSLLRLLSPGASDAPPAMDMDTFLNALRQGPRDGSSMKAMPTPPRQVTPPPVQQLPELMARKEGGAARSAAKAARTRSADDLRRALQDDLVGGGHAVPNAKVVDEVLRVMRSRTADAGAKRDEVLNVLKQHYPEAKMSDLRRALVRTRPYLDDAGGDIDKARDMIERRRATGAKTYAIPAAVGAGAMAQEESPLMQLWGGTP